MARLQILNGKQQGSTIEITEQGEHQVGTARAAKIQLRDKGIAFKHANFILEGDSLWVQDLGSSAGVIVGADKVAENQKIKLKDGDKVTLGTTELQVSLANAPAPAATPAPAPAASATAPAAPAPAPAATGPGAPAKSGSEADTLLAELREMKSRLSQRDKEVKELTAALDAAAVGAKDEGAGSFYGDTAATELESTIVELRQQNDTLNAGLLERDEAISNLRKDIDALKKEHELKLAEERKKRSALERDVQRGMDDKLKSKDERKGLEGDLDEIRVSNERLVLENDELKDKVAGLEYRMEQEAARRGEMVRQRIAEVQAENKRLEESNAELRTLVEAYEEKIDELDEKVEELEGEHEEIEKQLDEAREEIAKAKAAKDSSEKTLRQRIQRLEQRNEEVEAEVQRLRATGATRAAADEGAVSADLKTRLAIYERYLDDVEAAAEAQRGASRLRELEAEVEAVRSKLAENGQATDAAALEQKLLELEKKTRADDKKIERLEKKNRELVRANVQAEMSRQEAERKLSELGVEGAKKG